MATDTLTAVLEDQHLRLVLVNDLGRDALIFTRYGLALIDAEAAEERPGAIVEFISR